MKRPDYFINLFNRLLEGSCSPEDTQALIEWLGSEELDPLASNLIQAEIEKMPDPTTIDPAIKERLAAQLPAILAMRETPVVRVSPWPKLLKIAAVVLAIALPVSYAILRAPKQAVVISHQEIKPGTDKAILTLADGSQVTLDSSGNQVLVQGNTTIKQLGGELLYDANTNGEVSYNKLSTQRANQFKVKLPDGTTVWLNASSEITYPTVFTGNERVVTLEGQAYFDVAQNASQPFKVKTKTGIVEALGTSFDIMSYPDEPSTNTTLVSGAVRVSSGDQSVVLQPGMQAVYQHQTGKIKVNKVNVESVIAWKNGVFVLNNAGISVIMRQIQRWYDVEIEYRAGFKDEEYGGEIPRDYPMSDVINVLQQSGVKCELQGRKIIMK
ncbi:FecR family protein [Chitinophaga skermanii]|uniref:FecR family protein n=1 Tax=Chitinophaga skermanii TaxID=331697 RepID=A0A327Q4E8_9BACT|nr:FecR family protein [Chitinophaga skermanii]RAI99385.1 FecR family protein [Chitinophaga skermanii]